MNTTVELRKPGGLVLSNLLTISKIACTTPNRIIERPGIEGIEGITIYMGMVDKDGWVFDEFMIKSIPKNTESFNEKMKAILNGTETPEVLKTIYFKTDPKFAGQRVRILTINSTSGQKDYLLIDMSGNELPTEYVIL